MGAENVEWDEACVRSPPSLVQLSVSSLMSGPLGWQTARAERGCLPWPVQLEAYLELWRRGRLCQLGWELAEVDVLERLLCVWERRSEVETIFQAACDHGLDMAAIVAAAFLQGLHSPSQPCAAQPRLLRQGFRLGRFLLDTAWFQAAAAIFRGLLRRLTLRPHAGLCPLEQLPLRRLEAALRLLEAENGDWDVVKAKQTGAQVRDLLQVVERAEEKRKDEEEKEEETKKRSGVSESLELTDVYVQLAQLSFAYSNFEEALKLSLCGLRRLSERSGMRSIVGALRMTGKVLVVRRRMEEASALLEEAVGLAERRMGGDGALAEALLDWGFCLINRDEACAAAGVQERGLELRRRGCEANLRLGQAHEELAYALYVREYASGLFRGARQHADAAIAILSRLLSPGHLLLASAKRVKALILEEIAIDSDSPREAETLLAEAESLHLSALRLSQSIFGDENLQTAKHLGNLGRLYQSMKRLPEAEDMHRQAIQIKRRLLGDSDYEVALSMGHLASLYAYDLNRHEEAIALYLDSVRIGRELLGEAYSGLEYDYRGLIHSFQALGDEANLARYNAAFAEWAQLRQAQLLNHVPHNIFQSLPPPKPPIPFIADFLRDFKE